MLPEEISFSQRQAVVECMTQRVWLQKGVLLGLVLYLE
jgi:hypothetical protein